MEKRLFAIRYAALGLCCLAFAAFGSQSANATARLTHKRRYRKPPVSDRAHPNWAIGLHYVPDLFDHHGLSLQGDYQPGFLVGSAGLVNIGTHINFYGEQPRQDHSVTLGVQARYQGRWFANQLIVPVIGYTAESDSVGWLYGPLAGLYLNLNPFNEYSANKLFRNHGIVRTYFTVEFRQVTNFLGLDGNTLEGYIGLAGLRVELD